MFLKSLLSISGLVSTLDFVAAQTRYINSTVEGGIWTACKVCPWNKCINTKIYPYLDEVTLDTYSNVTLTCWTRGELIGGSDGNKIWLGTVDNCYVNQYDMVSYNGSYQHDLEYCGEDSEDEFYTTEDASTQFDTECNINPWINSDTIKYLPPNEDITATCWTNGDLIIDDDVWVRTTDLCYAAEKGLTDKIDKDSLDNCGPVPQLEVNATGSVNADSRRHFYQFPVLESRKANYLINVTVGEDFALCHEEPLTTSPVVTEYPWMTEVFLQCITENKDPADPNNTYWELTTEFCYVRSADFFQSPEGDYYKYPDCSNFGQDK